MKKLDELNDAVLSLNALSLVCPKKDKEKILDKRDELDRQAIALADKLLKEGTPELVDAINALSELTKTAIKAKKEIDNIGKTIIKTADILDKATAAIAAVAKVVAVIAAL